MERLKAFLITRLLAVTGVILLAEAVLYVPVHGIILPLAAHVAQAQPSGGRVRLTDILAILNSIFFGSGRVGLISLSARSLAGLLLLLALFLVLLPIAAGIMFYAGLVAARVDELQRQRDAEREANDARRNLMLSDFAHDLRTPIMTISGYAGALSDGMIQDEETRKEYLEAIRRKSVRMSELITLLFEYVKLGSVSFHLNKKSCDINELVTETAAAAYMDAEDAGMTLAADIPEEPFMAEADRAQAGRILNNLLVNAIRHNPAGTVITVRVTRLAGMEEIAVADNGVAIAKTEQELFAPFVRGDDSRSGDKGSGLGLSISKKIADMHGWELGLRQPYGEYTKAFVLRVPQE